MATTLEIAPAAAPISEAADTSNGISPVDKQLSSFLSLVIPLVHYNENRTQFFWRKNIGKIYMVQLKSNETYDEYSNTFIKPRASLYVLEKTISNQCFFYEIQKISVSFKNGVMTVPKRSYIMSRAERLPFHTTDWLHIFNEVYEYDNLE